MEQARKNVIYDRLLSIKFSIEIQVLPNPQYINEKLGQCHVFIEEIERFIIELSRELSVLQQAFNNAFASYESKKEQLLTHDENIRNLPSIRDREARANSLLRNELELIKKYKNEESDINNLLKVSYLKNRNLNRANQDIKMQLRILESQVKLGTPFTSDNVTKNFIAELNKSSFNKDIFQDVKTEISQEIIVDPTEPLNIENLLVEDSTKELISDKLIEPVPVLSDIIPEKLLDLVKSNETINTDTLPNKYSSLVKSDGTLDMDVLFSSPEEKTIITEKSNVQDACLDEELKIIEEETWPEIDVDSNILKDTEVDNNTVIDLDIVIDFKKGGNIEHKNKEQKEVMMDTTQKESHQNQKIGINIDDLLNSLNTN